MSGELKPWLWGDKILVDAQGQPLLCDVCPCPGSGSYGSGSYGSGSSGSSGPSVCQLMLDDLSKITSWTAQRTDGVLIELGPYEDVETTMACTSATGTFRGRWMNSAYWYVLGMRTGVSPRDCIICQHLPFAAMEEYGALDITGLACGEWKLVMAKYGAMTHDLMIRANCA